MTRRRRIWCPTEFDGILSPARRRSRCLCRLPPRWLEVTNSRISHVFEGVIARARVTARQSPDFEMVTTGLGALVSPSGTDAPKGGAPLRFLRGGLRFATIRDNFCPGGTTTLVRDATDRVRL